MSTVSEQIMELSESGRTQNLLKISAILNKTSKGEMFSILFKQVPSMLKTDCAYICSMNNNKNLPTGSAKLDLGIEGQKRFSNLMVGGILPYDLAIFELGHYNDKPAVFTMRFSKDSLGAAGFYIETCILFKVFDVDAKASELKRIVERDWGYNILICERSALTKATLEPFAKSIVLVESCSKEPKGRKHYKTASGYSQAEVLRGELRSLTQIEEDIARDRERRKLREKLKAEREKAKEDD